MHKVEIRPGVWMAYEDDWLGKPWTVPETVVMVHGNSESSRAWITWVPQLAGQYRVVRLDLPGFGESTEPPDYGWSAGELAADIGHFLDALGIETCHLIGAKYGGSACMQLASDQPRRFRSLCLFGSPVRGSGSANADAIRAKGVRQWAAETMRARLGGSASHQKHILRNLAADLFTHGRITTTEAKARLLRPFAEKLITKAKKGDIHNRREVRKTITDVAVLHTLFTEIGPRYADRSGGYTRILKLGTRHGDNAPMARIEFV